MRALEPAQAGKLDLAGFQIGYEVFGAADAPPVLLLPAWQIVHSRIWKLQVPYLARCFRVITYDSAGNGSAERTTDPRAFEYDRIVDQAVGLLDHLYIAQTSVIGLSRGCVHGLWMAARYPMRVARLVCIANGVTLDMVPTLDPGFWEPRPSYTGWGKRNAHYWHADFRGWLEFFFGEVFPEPHSSKPIEDAVGWGLETSPDILERTVENSALLPRLPSRDALQRVRCPVLILHGDDDRVLSISASRKLAAARPDWEFVALEGCGHVPSVRDPIKVNQEIGRFLGLEQAKQRTWRRAASRSTPRALFVSSPIGLGHAQRDLAIARELRRLVPELEIDWLAQPPVTEVLERNGETIHPLSKLLASESAHWERSSRDHTLHCFYAWRAMDEILCTNFMVFLDAVRETPYDVWIGDEAWEVDYYLHENPELKTAPFVFLTDFVGWLPIDRSPGSREAALTADYNAEMIEQVRRYKRVRDRALYIGDYDDLVPERFGLDLPFIPEWTREHFDAVGYVVPFDPAEYTDTRTLRARLGYDPDRPLIVCAVGGTAVGEPLLRKTIEAWPLIREGQPEAQGVIIAGPRIDPGRLTQPDGLQLRPYVHDLFEHLAAADLGVVQGGLSTTMELTVNRRPFVYFPIKNHCEQEYNVAYRLDHYRAGRRMQLAQTQVQHLAQAALETLGSDTAGYRKHVPGAATRAAMSIAELL